MGIQVSDDLVYDFLEHHGVKGMRWGVRRQRRIDNLRRASAGVGGLATKARAFRNLGVVDLVKGHGIKGGAARKADRIEARAQRITDGKASVMDKIKQYGTAHVEDIIPVRESQVGKKSSVSRDKVLVAAAGALFAAKMISSRFPASEM